jgi:hypothetical protein
LFISILQTKKKRGSSSSNWGDEEVHAVRAIPLIDLDPKRIIPEEFFQRNNDGKLIHITFYLPIVDIVIGEVFAMLRKEIRVATIDHLKAFRGRDFFKNSYQNLFGFLAELCTTYTSEESIARARVRQLSISSNNRAFHLQ